MYTSKDRGGVPDIPAVGEHRVPEKSVEISIQFHTENRLTCLIAACNERQVDVLIWLFQVIFS